MGSNKAEATRKKRGKSLSQKMVLDIIAQSRTKSRDELAVQFGVSKATIEKVFREVRRQNPNWCQKQRVSLESMVALALKQLEAEISTQGSSPEQSATEQRVVNIARK